MRLLLFTLCLLLTISCSKKITNKKPRFLIGNWKRIHKDKNKDQLTYEYWNNNLTGLGITIKNKDTVFKEILSIISINDTLTLKVEGVNNTATLFKITQQTDSSFTAENPTHDFPTKIIYWLDKNRLKAHVSNNEIGIDFEFERQ